MRVREIAVAELEGVPKKNVRKKIRKCKFCSKVLSMYNDNKYCFAHSRKGWKLEEEEKTNGALEKQKKYYAKLKRLRKKAEKLK